jgi:predicted DNA-binding transcriptional regulator AlpA
MKRITKTPKSKSKSEQPPQTAKHMTNSTISAAPTETNINLAGGIRLSKWRRQVGLSRTTVWRWRKEGRLPVVERYGVAFLTAETVKSFFAADHSKTRP